MPTNELALLDESVHVKSFKLKVDSVDDQTGEFSAYASVFNILDSDREIVAPGAFIRSLNNNVNIVVLADHDVRRQIGFNVEAHEDAIGLRVKAQLALDNSDARDKYALIKLANKLNEAGHPVKAGISIGFRVIQSKMMAGRELKGVKGVEPTATYRVFTECALLEYSVVALGANQEAYVTAVKAKYDASNKSMLTRGMSIKNRVMELAESRRKDFNQELDEQRTMSALWQERCDIETALSSACSDCMDNDMMTPDDKKAEITATYTQYAAAMADWYSRFIDADLDDDPEDDMPGMDGMDEMGKNEKAGRQISAATADCIKAAMSHMADGAACHTKALGLLEDLSKRPYTANDVNMPNPAGGGKSAELDAAAIKQIVVEAVQELETARTKSQTEGDPHMHSLINALNSVAGLIKTA